MAAGDESKRLSEKEARTRNISDLTRYIAFGLMALTYTVFTSKSDFSTSLIEDYEGLFLTASIMGVLSIASDYLQNLCGYISVKKALIESDYRYSRKWISYKLITLFFGVKQLAALIGVVLVFIAMLLTILQ